MDDFTPSTNKRPGAAIKHFFKKNLTAIFCVIMTAAVTYTITVTSTIGQMNRQLEELNASGVDLYKVAEVAEYYKNNYVGGELDKETMTDYALYGLVTGTGDKYGTYMSKSEFANYTENMNGGQIGIGVNVTYNALDNTVKIMSVYDGTPAQDAGLQPGDYIVGANGKTMEELGYAGLVNEMMGEEGETVTVTVAREQQQQEYTMNRARFDIQSATAEMLENHIGYITISEFNTKTPEQFQAAMETVLADPELKGIIYDVRNNGGGDAEAIGAVLDMLMGEGTVFTLVDKSGTEIERYDSDAESMLPEGMKTAVLVNANTASAAELFSAGMQDEKLGTIIGETTFGKGTGLSVVSLSDGSGLVFSTTLYYTPAGRNLENVGVIPDVEIKLTEKQNANFYDMTVEEDPQMQAAIKELTK